MFKRILVATDGSDHAMKAVELACELAGKHDAELNLIHVQLSGPIPEGLREMVRVEHLVEPGERPALTLSVGPGGMATVLTEAGEDGNISWKIANALGQQILSQAEDLVKSKGIRNVRSFLEEGDPSASILKTAEKIAADLVVLGSRGLGGIMSLLLGSVSHTVVQKSRCTCITVK